MTTAITITDFTPADEAATMAFCRQIFRDEGWPLEFMDPTIWQRLRCPARRLSVGETEGDHHRLRRVERALRRRRPHDPLLRRPIAPRHRSRVRLFEGCLPAPGSCDYTSIVLDVNRDSARAIRFYEKQGMERFIPTPHPRWLESTPDEHQYAHYFRKRV